MRLIMTMRNLKFIFSLLLLATLIFSAATCAAADVWVDHLKKGNFDLYIIDDTINAGANPDYFSISVKYVKKGKLDKIVNWKFSKRKTDSWHYSTVEKNGVKDKILPAPNGIFEFCMNQLGWSYRVDGGNYY